MAISAITAKGFATHTVSQASVATPPGPGAITVDKIVMVSCVSDNLDTTDGPTSYHLVTDTHGHTWEKVFEETETDGAAADGSTTSLWRTKVTTQIETTDSITNTYQGGNADAGIITIVECVVDSGNTLDWEPTQIDHNVLTSTLSSLTNREYLFYGLHGAEGADTTKTAITNYTERFDLRSGTAATGDVQIHVGTRILTGTGDTWTSSATSFTNGIQSLTAFYEVAEGTAHTATPTDPEGLVDTATQVTDSARPQTDPLGLVDAAAQVTDSVRSLTDPLGLVDDVTAQISGGNEQTFTDPLGLVDSAAQVSDTVRSQTDPLGLVDSATSALDIAVTITDPLGLADDGEWIAIGADAIGILDTTTVVQAHARTVDDAVGLVDSVTAENGQAAAQTDPLGITDTAAGVTDSARPIDDALGLADGIIIELVTAATPTDPEGLVDSAAHVAGYLRDVTDPFGLSDSITVEATGQISVTLTDVEGLIDSATAVTDSVRTVTDPLGLVDDASYVWTPAGVAHITTVTDPLGLVDAASYIQSVGGLAHPFTVTITDRTPGITITDRSPTVEVS